MEGKLYLVIYSYDNYDSTLNPDGHPVFQIIGIFNSEVEAKTVFESFKNQIVTKGQKEDFFSSKLYLSTFENSDPKIFTLDEEFLNRETCIRHYEFKL